MVSVLWPASLAAQASSSALRVEVISCVLEESAVDVSEMLAIARAELAPRELGPREGDADGSPLLRVDACHDQYLLLRSLKPLGQEHRVALHDVPIEQRPRVAALALAELVVVTLAQPAPPAPPPPAPAASAPAAAKSSSQPLPDWAPVEATPDVRPVTLGFGAEARLFTDTVEFSFGPRLELGLPYLDLALVGLFDRQTVELGEYHSGLVALSPSYALFRSRTRAQVSLAIGADLGISWVQAEPYEPAYGSAEGGVTAYLAGFGQLTLGGPLSARTYGRIAVSGGYGYGARSRQHDADGTSQVEATTRGPFASFALGLAWAM